MEKREQGSNLWTIYLSTLEGATLAALICPLEAKKIWKNGTHASCSSCDNSDPRWNGC